MTVPATSEDRVVEQTRARAADQAFALLRTSGHAARRRGGDRGRSRGVPRIGGYVVAAWLAGIIVNLLLIGNYYLVALRDFGLLVGALAPARPATARRR